MRVDDKIKYELACGDGILSDAEEATSEEIALEVEKLRAINAEIMGQTATQSKGRQAEIDRSIAELENMIKQNGGS